MMRAMPAASLRSLLLTCILSTALAWRASIQITGRPSCLTSVHSHVAVGPVSHRSMSASTTRPVQHSAPLLLSIFARPHQDGLICCWRADSLGLCLALDPGITPCCKTLLRALEFSYGK